MIWRRLRKQTQSHGISGRLRVMAFALSKPSEREPPSLPSHHERVESQPASAHEAQARGSRTGSQLRRAGNRPRFQSSDRGFHALRAGASTQPVSSASGDNLSGNSSRTFSQTMIRRASVWLLLSGSPLQCAGRRRTAANLTPAARWHERLLCSFF